MILQSFLAAFVLAIFGYIFKTWQLGRRRSSKIENKRKVKILFSAKVFLFTFVAVFIYLYISDSPTITEEQVEPIESVLEVPSIEEPIIEAVEIADNLPLNEIVETTPVELPSIVEQEIIQPNNEIEIRRKKTTPKFRRGLPM